MARNSSNHVLEPLKKKIERHEKHDKKARSPEEQQLKKASGLGDVTREGLTKEVLGSNMDEARINHKPYLRPYDTRP